MKGLLFFWFLLPIVCAGQGKIAKPIIIGESVSLYSDILHEQRVLNVYLPGGYQENDTSRYPVVYLLDGGMDEDFIHIAGLFQFTSFPWINWFPPAIVVGIVNTDRIRDMTFPTRDTAFSKLYPTAGGSEKFIRFIKDELQPYIVSHYKVSRHTSLIGQSLGGLLATEILLKQPQTFDNYFIVSPSLWWDDGSLLRASSPLLESSWRHHTNVFIAVGKEGQTPGTHPHVMEVDAKLLAEKIRESKSSGVKTIFDYLPEEDHATILHQAMLDGLKAMKNNSVVNDN